MEIYLDIIKSIVKAQMQIIGPMAIEEARKTNCIELDYTLKDIKITTEPQQAVEKLIEQYAELFGAISIEVSKEALQRALKDKSTDNIVLPSILK